jgi:hypothetical protein
MYGLRNSTPNTVTEMKLKNLDGSRNLESKEESIKETVLFA